MHAVYPKPLNKTVRVVVPALSDLFCGMSRPGHFVGVATVVNMLFNLVQPDFAVFGQKDYQQLLVVRRMVEDLHLPVQVLGTPTVRYSDGLAMSSRNAYLNEQERQQAPRLYQTLCWARDQLKGGKTDREALERQAAGSLDKAGFRVEYFAIRRAADLELPDEREGPSVLLAAAWLGQTRLIDNVLADGAEGLEVVSRLNGLAG